MTSASTTYQENPGASSKMLIAMVGIGVLCALLIVLTYEGTLPAIKRNKAAALEQAIFKVLPGISYKRSFEWTADQGFRELQGAESEGPVVHAGYNQEDQMLGLAVEASGIGFADVLRILYGYDPQSETIVGFYVLESKETPGLGDKIEKDDAFLANFKALDVKLNSDKKTLVNPVVPVKNGAKTQNWEVDGITGATISSRAIGNILGASTAEWLPRLQQQLNSFTEKKMANE